MLQKDFNIKFKLKFRKSARFVLAGTVFLIVYENHAYSNKT